MRSQTGSKKAGARYRRRRRLPPVVKHPRSNAWMVDGDNGGATVSITALVLTSSQRLWSITHAFGNRVGRPDGAPADYALETFPAGCSAVQRQLPANQGQARQAGFDATVDASTPRLVTYMLVVHGMGGR